MVLGQNGLTTPDQILNGGEHRAHGEGRKRGPTTAEKDVKKEVEN